MDSKPGSIDWSPGAELTLSAGPIQICLCADPLETLLRTQSLDAVVSSDDTMLSASEGVSRLIHDLAGDAMQREVARNVPLAVGSIAVTCGGNLPVKYVIHAVTVDRANDIRPTLRTIHQLIRAVLSRCEALGIARLAIPALATGTAQLDPMASAEIIAVGLREHALNPTMLHAVFLPIPSQPDRTGFARALMRPVLEDLTVDIPVRAERPSSSRELDVPRSPVRTLVSRLLRRGTARESSDSTKPASLASAPSGRTDYLAAPAGSRQLLGERYVLLEEIGRGGMAVVYLSWDLVLRRTLAVKVPRREIPDSHSLKREAAAALELTHESIVRMYHFEPGNAQKRGYLVMEYVPWPSGEKWIADAGLNGLPVRPVVDVSAQICRAVAYAHTRNLLHLDIKPSNLFVDPGGEQAKLGDFGLARVSNAQGTAMQLQPAGTPAYMAPEQREPWAKVSSATDVYQLGATMWDLLTGHPPKRDRMDAANLEPERRRVLDIVAFALVDDPTRRPSAARLADRLSHAIG